MFKKLSIYLILFLFSLNANAKNYPASFADLAERLIPSVVNISTTQIITTRTVSLQTTEFVPGAVQYAGPLAAKPQLRRKDG